MSSLGGCVLDVSNESDAVLVVHEQLLGRVGGRPGPDLDLHRLAGDGRLVGRLQVRVRLHRPVVRRHDCGQVDVVCDGLGAVGREPERCKSKQVGMSSVWSGRRRVD